MMADTGYSEVSYSKNDSRMLQGPPQKPSDLNTADGVFVSGAMIFNALAAGNLDAVENEWVTLDECIMHPTPNKQLHYHMWSPCAIKGNGWASTTTAPNMCKDDKNCRTDPISFAINKAWTNTDTFSEVIGISKDGFMIYGPYNSEGELWDCSEKDFCNGTFVDGNYVYVSTTTFPYILGCFGPAATTQTYGVTCSSASCPVGDSDLTNTGAYSALFGASIISIATAISLSLSF